MQAADCAEFQAEDGSVLRIGFHGNGAAASCTSGSKIDFNASGGMTGPWLTTWAESVAGVPRTVVTIGDPLALYWPALVSRFVTTCCTRCPSKKPFRSPGASSSNQ